MSLDHENGDKVAFNRYALFEFDQYYPSGGWLDFVKSFDTIEDAIAFFNLPRPRSGEPDWDYPRDHFQVVDLETCEVIAEDIPDVP